MIVEVPFYYELPYIPHRSRKAKTAIVLDSAPIEIAEAAGDEAPVVLRVDAERFSRSWNAGKPRDYRYWNGAFWRPYSVESTGQKGEKLRLAMTSDEFARAAARKGGRFTSNGMSWKFDHGVTLNSLMPCRPQAVPESLRASVIREIESRAADVLFVAGIAYHRISEPVYRVKQWGDVPRQSSIEVVHVAQINAKDDPSEFFRADRFDEAAAEYERRTGEAFDQMNSRESVGGPIEVLRPAVLGFCYDMRPRVLDEAKEILSWMKSGLEKCDLPFAAAYIHLRDATKDKASVDHDAVAEIIGNEVVKAMRNNGDWDWMIERGEKLLADWRNREDPSVIRDQDVAALAM
jgi:hypothetical protein